MSIVQGQSQHMIIVPARMASQRFAGKVLADFSGSPILVRVVERLSACERAQNVIVATDSEEVFRVMEDHGYRAIMTGDHHICGTDRCAEVARKLEIKGWVINVQADQPLIDPRDIDQVFDVLEQGGPGEIVSLYTDLEESEQGDENRVKVYIDEQSRAEDFSRQFKLGNTPTFKHLGVYGFAARDLLLASSFEPTEREMKERLEQLRWMENGLKIRMIPARGRGISVDSPDDLKDLLDGS